MSTGFRYAIHRGGKSFGVESVSKLHDLACRRKLGPQDYVFDYIRRQWVRAESITELQPIFAAHREIASIDFSKLQSLAEQQELSAPELSRSEMREFISMTLPSTKRGDPARNAITPSPPPAAKRVDAPPAPSRRVAMGKKPQAPLAAVKAVPNAAASGPPEPPHHSDGPSMTESRMDLNHLFDGIEQEATFEGGSAYRLTFGQDREQRRDEVYRKFSVGDDTRSLINKATAGDLKQAGRKRAQSARRVSWAVAAAVLLVGLIALGAFWVGVNASYTKDIVYVTQIDSDTTPLPIRNVSP